jgi:hypothetical protein
LPGQEPHAAAPAVPREYFNSARAAYQFISCRRFARALKKVDAQSLESSWQVSHSPKSLAHVDAALSSPNLRPPRPIVYLSQAEVTSFVGWELIWQNDTGEREFS